MWRRKEKVNVEVGRFVKEKVEEKQVQEKKRERINRKKR